MAKILLVEDDNNLREIFELRLIAEGYQTVTAGNGEEALVVAMKEKPDLIIADVMMPKLSGFEMLETLRAAPEMADTKCIMMTALGQAEDRARGESLGVIKYLVKSQVTLEDFVRVVREVVAPDGNTPTGTTQPNSQPQTNQGGTSMQPDSQTPAPADSGATPNPINDTAAAGSSATPDQPTAAQEQSQVQDQINNFVSSTPAGDATTPAAPTTPGADASTPASGSDAAPAADTNAGPSVPTNTAPAPETQSQETTPPASTGTV